MLYSKKTAILTHSFTIETELPARMRTEISGNPLLALEW